MIDGEEKNMGHPVFAPPLGNIYPDVFGRYFFLCSDMTI